MELEVTWKRATRVWWSYLWRNLIAIVAAMIAGAFIGGVLGMILGLMGVPVVTIKIVATPIGLVLGLLISIVPVKLILGRNYGEFRLVLLSTAVPPVLPIPPEKEGPNKSPEPTTMAVTPRATSPISN